MSRIGRLPIVLPEGVSVNKDSENIIVKGPHGVLEREIPAIIDVEILIFINFLVILSACTFVDKNWAVEKTPPDKANQGSK